MSLMREMIADGAGMAPAQASVRHPDPAGGASVAPPAWRGLVSLFLS
jgi:hypothetical protein